MIGAGYLLGIVVALGPTGDGRPRTPPVVLSDGAAGRLSLAIDPCVDVDGEQVRRLLMLELGDLGNANGQGRGLVISVGCEGNAQLLRVDDTNGKPTARRAVNLRATGRSGRDARSRELALAVAELVRRREVMGQRRSEGATPLGSGGSSGAAAPSAAAEASRPPVGPAPVTAGTKAAASPADVGTLPKLAATDHPALPVASDAAAAPVPAQTVEWSADASKMARADAAPWALQVGVLGAVDAYWGGKQEAGGDLIIRALSPDALVLQARLGGRRLASTQLPRGQLDATGWGGELGGGFVVAGGVSRVTLMILGHIQMQVLRFHVAEAGGTLSQQTTYIAVVAGVGPSASLPLGRRLKAVAALTAGGVVHGVTIRVQGSPANSVSGAAVSAALGVVAQF